MTHPKYCLMVQETLAARDAASKAATENELA